ncbi:hypothetical protein, partial [Plasmodium yoelii yoelii]
MEYRPRIDNITLSIKFYYASKIFILIK